jgi:hypothetical protein
VWAPDLSAGYGQPLFQFAPPLVYAAALPFHAAGARLADSIQLGLALLHLAGAIAVYRLGRRWPASRTASLGGAAAWLFAPYTALDLYVRSAYAEASAVAIAPLALLALVRVVDRPGATRVAAAGAAVALVILGHNGAALLFLPALGAAVLAAGLARSRAGLLSGAGALALALGLSAFFWLPAVAEKDFVQTDLLRADFLHWSQHAVAPHQLLWSPWGYGLSGPGTGDGLSFALGWAQLLLAAFGVVSVWQARANGRRLEYGTYALLAAGGAWLATSWSSVVWANVATLQYLAYPWRALMLPGLFLPLLAVPALDRLRPRLAAAALAVVVLANLGHTEPKGYVTYDDEYYAPASIAEKGINTTTREEYQPRWMRTRPPYTPERLRGRPGEIQILEQDLASARQEFRLRAGKETVVEAMTAYYPGWVAEIDGRTVPVEPISERGTLSLAVPEGEHRLVLELRPTPVRALGQRVSMATVLVLVALLSIAVWRRRRPAA